MMLAMVVRGMLSALAVIASTVALYLIGFVGARLLGTSEVFAVGLGLSIALGGVIVGRIAAEELDRDPSRG